jgi:hypothetical protein
MIAGLTFISELVFEVFTNSRERCERVEETLRENLADFLVTVERKYEDMDFSKLRKARKTGSMPGRKPLEIPAELLLQVYRKLYANWSSEPLPLLGNISPKEAVETAEGRRKVKNILKSYEITPDGQRVDLTFLWNEVGLKKPD